MFCSSEVYPCTNRLQKDALVVFVFAVTTVLGIVFLSLFANKRLRNDTYFRARGSVLVAVQSVAFGIGMVLTFVSTSQVLAFQVLVKQNAAVWTFASQVMIMLFVSILYVRMLRLYRIQQITAAQVLLSCDVQCSRTESIICSLRECSTKQWAARRAIALFLGVALISCAHLVAKMLVGCGVVEQLTVDVVFWSLLSLVQVGLLLYMTFHIKNVGDSADQWRELVALSIATSIQRFFSLVAQFGWDNTCESSFVYNLAAIFNFVFVVVVGCFFVFWPLMIIHMYGNGLWFLHKDEQPLTQELNIDGWVFADVLDSEWGRECFKNFLMREFAVENILFDSDVIKFRANPTREMAASIVRTYFLPDAPMLLNLNFDIRETVKAVESEGGEITETMFDAADNEVRATLRRDSFMRFCKSHEASMMVARSRMLGNSVRRDRKRRTAETPLLSLL